MNTNTSAYITLSDSEGDEEYNALPVKKPTTQPVCLDDDNDDDVYVTGKEKLTLPDKDDLLMSDEAYPDLVQRARERQQQQQQLNEKQRALERNKIETSYTKNNHATDEIDDIFGDNKAEVDPIVYVLITSTLKGTKKLIVRRRVSETLKQVRKAWIDYQEPGVFTDEMKSSIYLTWRSKELFDITTCAHLGIKVGSDGQLPSERLDHQGRLHLEAWTPDSFEAFQRQQNMGNGNAEPELEPEAELEEKVEKIRLILKAKDLAPIKVQMAPTSLVEKMIEYFHVKYPETVGKDVSLYFDGDKLDPKVMVKETELGEAGEVDTVEVTIR
jgi:hypothetical protein